MRIDFNQLRSKNIEEPAVTAAALKSGSPKSTSNIQESGFPGIMLGHSEENILSRDRNKKKSVMDQAVQADAMGVETQMDQMLVVAQTMSPQDAKKLADEGYDMSEMDPADAVNSLDRMKIRLAEAGINVAGYTDTVSADKVAAVTGQAMDSAELAENKAASAGASAIAGSGNSDNTLSKLTDEDIYFAPDVTEAEIADTLTLYDLPATKDNIASVKEAVNMASELQALTDNTRLFLASEGMEPTIENVFTAEFSSGKSQIGGNSRYVADDTGYVSKAGNVKLPDMADADGQAGFDPEFDRQISDVIEQAGYEDAPELKQDALSMINAGVPLTPDTLQIYEDTKNIDLRPAKKEVMDAIASGNRGKDAYLISDYKNIKAERVVKEAALSMATEVNLRNIDKDLTIDTGYLERDVESLKIMEKEVFDLLEMTLSVKSDILRAPAALVAEESMLDVFASMQRAAEAGSERISTETGGLTLDNIHDRARNLTREYERMDQTYEAVGTEVRADLGDSIRKAFANTDFASTLQDLGMEHNPANERAVRIASYSHMEFTTENIEKTGAADERLTSLLDKLTPARTLRMIRENINPLEISVDELDRRLTDYEDMEDRPTEDFAKYLVSEKNKGNITEDEATSYIGVYRLVNAINIGDHRAVGTLVASGVELSFSNLLSAVRTGHKSHIDQYIDEHFNGLDASVSQGNPRIDHMIRTAFAQGADSDAETQEREAYEEDARKFAEAAKAEAEIYRTLEAADIPRNANNVMAYEQLMAGGGNTFARELFNSASDKAKERLRETRARVREDLGSGDAAKIKESYDEMVKAELIGALEGESLDIRALQTKDKVLSVKQALADTEEYSIPTEFKGEIININLKLRHGENRNSVDIYFETEDFGSVHAGLRVTDGIRGAIKCERTAGDEYMRERLSAISEAVSRVSGKESNLKIGNMDVPDTNEAMDGDDAGSAMLYRMAKAVLDAVLSE